MNHALDCLPQPTAATVPELPIHRMSQLTGRPPWWRPLLTLVTAVGLYLGFVVGMLVIIFIAAAVSGTGDQLFASQASIDDMGRPMTQLMTIATLIPLWPAAALAVRLIEKRPARSVLTARRRFDWRLLGNCLLLSATLLGAVQLLSELIAPEPWPGRTGNTGTLIAAVLIALLLVPLQATAEEVAFRGLLPQLIGSWLRHPAFAYLLPVPLFVVGHGYDAVGLLDVAMFAIVAGWLTWRTQGLEAAIGLHVMNNVILFLLSAIGRYDPNTQTGTVLGLVVSAATTVLYAAIVAGWLTPNPRRRSHRRR